MLKTEIILKLMVNIKPIIRFRDFSLDFTDWVEFPETFFSLHLSLVYIVTTVKV